MKIYEIIVESEETRKRILEHLKREYTLVQGEVRKRRIKEKVKGAVRWLFGN